MRKLLSIAILLFLTLFACAKKEGGNPLTFVARLSADPPTLDPAHSTDTVSGRIVMRIFDGLVQLDPVTLEIVPDIAEKWEVSKDGKSYTFHLRKGVLFHNGRECRAQDFKYSFERVLNPETVSERTWVLSPIEGSSDILEGKAEEVSGIKVLDDYTLEISLSRHFAPFLSQITMEAGSVVPKEEVEKWGKDFTSHPVGTGAYRFVSWKHDVEVKLEAFEKHFSGKPEIPRLMYRIIADRSVALEEFKSGTIDLLDQIPTGMLGELKRTMPEELKVWPVVSTMYLGFNHERSPFKGNKLLRQAINYAMDKEGLSKTIMEGLTEPAHGIIPPGMKGFSEFKGYPYDPVKARELLRLSGYPEGKGLPEITLWYNTDTVAQRICQLMQANLSAIGIKVKLRNLDWAAFLNARNAGECEFFYSSWVADYADADNFLYILLDSKTVGAAGNATRYRNPQFDELVEKARESLDENERLSLYEKAERLAVEDAAWVFLAYWNDVCMIKKGWDVPVLPLQGDWAMQIEKLPKPS